MNSGTGGGEKSGCSTAEAGMGCSANTVPTAAPNKTKPVIAKKQNLTEILLKVLMVNGVDGHQPPIISRNTQDANPKLFKIHLAG
jgi:hypothetical protein